MDDGAVRELTAATFGEEVLGSPVPVVVDFWAEWCGPCKAIAPVLEELAVEHADRLRFAKIDVDAHPQPSVDYRVMSFPTLMVFVDGQPAKRMVGARGKHHLREELAEFIG